ncbi:hypothetical protein [Bordetella sp. N]|uniref:hypothetical protein n=1 Tax=Bordetella sp. N TaxID=1746199 RepID=UPI0012E3D275|nr:hypothetical protein [Bordetella sp. N]
MSDSVLTRPPAGGTGSPAACAGAANAVADAPELTLAVLAAHAGLALAPAHLAELVDAYRYVGPMLSRIQRTNARADEPAHVFVAKTFEHQAQAPTPG